MRLTRQSLYIRKYLFLLSYSNKKYDKLFALNCQLAKSGTKELKKRTIKLGVRDFCSPSLLFTLIFCKKVKITRDLSLKSKDKEMFELKKRDTARFASDTRYE